MFKEIRIENVENVHQQQFNLTAVLVIFMIKGMENILILNYIKWLRRLDGSYVTDIYHSNLQFLIRFELNETFCILKPSLESDFFYNIKVY